MIRGSKLTARVQEIRSGQGLFRCANCWKGELPAVRDREVDEASVNWGD